jgi:NADPH:quinone reductase-like Zn-dependent oxidoreductase
MPRTVSVDGGLLTRKPKELDWAQAAAIPEAWLTGTLFVLPRWRIGFRTYECVAAFQALFLVCEMKEGARVLIHAGASSVGIAAIQLAHGFGAKEVYTTAGSVVFSG